MEMKGFSIVLFPNKRNSKYLQNIFVDVLQNKLCLKKNGV
jgi:hypothetical protein